MADRSVLKSAIMALAILVGIPAAIGWAWGTWEIHEQRECQTSRLCREREAEAYRYVVDDEIRHASNYDDQRGE